MNSIINGRINNFVIINKIRNVFTNLFPIWCTLSKSKQSNGNCSGSSSSGGDLKNYLKKKLVKLNSTKKFRILLHFTQPARTLFRQNIRHSQKVYIFGTLFVYRMTWVIQNNPSLLLLRGDFFKITFRQLLRFFLLYSNAISESLMALRMPQNAWRYLRTQFYGHLRHQLSVCTFGICL